MYSTTGGRVANARAIETRRRMPPKVPTQHLNRLLELHKVQDLCTRSRSLFAHPILAQLVCHILARKSLNSAPPETQIPTVCGRNNSAPHRGTLPAQHFDLACVGRSSPPPISGSAFPVPVSPKSTNVSRGISSNDTPRNTSLHRIQFYICESYDREVFRLLREASKDFVSEIYAIWSRPRSAA